MGLDLAAKFLDLFVDEIAVVDIAVLSWASDLLLLLGRLKLEIVVVRGAHSVFVLVLIDIFEKREKGELIEMIRMMSSS